MKTTGGVPGVSRTRRREIAIVLNALAIGFVCLFFTGCNPPSYPKERLTQEVENLVRREYGYKIKARVVGKTLGLYYPATQMFNYDFSEVDSFETKRQDIFLSAVRVALSTDADLNFFANIYTDEFKGIEISVVRSVMDTKRFLLGDISRNDYSDRAMIEYRYDPQQLASKTIRKFFEDIPKKKSGASAYFLPGKSYNESFFFRHLMESELKENIAYSIITTKTKRTDKDKVLVYVKIRETYTPKAGYEAYPFSFPSRSVNEFLFEVTVIKGIIPIITNTYAYKDAVNGKEIVPPMPSVFAKDADISTWDSYFYMEDVKLSDFIIKQVASRINRKLNEAANPNAVRMEDDPDSISEPQNVIMVEGEYLPGQAEHENNNNVFQLVFKFQQNARSTVVSGELTDLILKYFLRTLRKYDFYDYRRLVFLASDGLELNSFDKKALDALQFDRFSWKSLFKFRPSEY